MAYSFHWLAFFCFFLLFLLKNLPQFGLAWSLEPDVPPTQGFVSLPLNQSYYHIQKPYDLPEDQRYCFIHGVHKCWVYSTDKPHTTTSQTLPRTEIAIQVSLVYMHKIVNKKVLFATPIYHLKLQIYQSEFIVSSKLRYKFVTSPCSTYVHGTLGPKLTCIRCGS